MRGKAVSVAAGEPLTRITPAYAGKSRVYISADLLRRDHPRLCGEKRAVYSPSGKGLGSPPPMRGKVLFFDDSNA